jgi:GT2 family glycosyltransferase
MSLDQVGVVLIGRNEGERLRACLTSLGALAARAVYVDSGSTDGSIEAAAAMGIKVVSLSMDRPFTAARARNAGFTALEQSFPDLRYVQFIDGDCILQPEWVQAALNFLESNETVAIVAGRRRERFVDASVYNWLCDQEWARAAGETDECGGDALVRIAAFRAVGGYADELIAGEEPDMCLRMREKGWRIWRLTTEMTLHDANITAFGQWWRRSLRAGHAFAEVSWRHRGSPMRIWTRNVRSALVWGSVFPALVLFATCLIDPVWLILVLVYPVQVLRLILRKGQGKGTHPALAVFLVLGKFPEAQGILTFHAHRFAGRQRQLIEYK